MRILEVTGKRDKKADLLNYNKDFKIDDLHVDVICYFDIYYDGGFKYIDSGKELDLYDYYRTGGGKGETMIQGFCYYYLFLLGKKAIDSRKETKFNGDKFTQLIFSNYYDISIPESIFFVIDSLYTSKYIEILEKKFKYPFIAKNVEGSRGEQVFLINNQNDLKDLFESNEYNGIVFQEYIENNGDYRILAVGDKVIGGFKRFNKDSFKNNISNGGLGEKFEVHKDLEDLSVNILKQFGLGIAGLDFFIIDNKPILIEINPMPQFRGFEKTLGISFNEKIFEYFKSLEK